MTRRRVAVALSLVAGVVVLALVATTLFTVWSVHRAHPEYEGTVDVPGLRGDVQVVRGEHGIPQIYADTAEDLFFGQGYVHAQDRFWEMDLRRHLTAGRLSELFGESQIETDIVIRTLGWRRVAEQELPLLEPATRRYLQAYAAGVNAWLDSRSGGELGLQYTLLGLTGGDTSPEPWKPVDSLSWLKAMAWDLRGNMENEVERALLADELPVERVEQLFPPHSYDRAQPIVADAYLPNGPVPPPVEAEVAQLSNASTTAAEAVPEVRTASRAIRGLTSLLGSVAGSGIGSNSWVVDGSRTATGAPLLANDPHLPPGMPSVWYQVGLHCRVTGPKCPFEVTGFSFSGMPGVVIGHNADVAWGFTNMNPDVTDLFLEKVDGDNYLVGDEMVPMETRRETIRVAGADNVTVRVRSTRHGPLVSDHDDQLAAIGENPGVDDEVAAVREAGDDYAVALRWTALDPGRTADALFALNQATDWASFRAAAQWFEVPAQNLVYADVRGNIGYQAPGKIPVRRSGDGRWPVPGWTGEYDWAGYLPFDYLPSVYNPGEGYIVTANQPVASPVYPALLTRDFAYGYRAARIRQLIEQADPLDVEAMQDLQQDSRNPFAPTLVPYLLDIENLDGYYGDGVDLLRDWDYTQPADSAAAAYFNMVWSRLLELTFADELPDDVQPSGDDRWFEVIRALLETPDDPYWDDVSTPEVEDRDAILWRTLRDARNEMTRHQGKDPSRWAWGRLHTLTLTDPSFGTSGIALVESMVNRGPIELAGGAGIVNATSWHAADGFEASAVPSMRMVVDLGDLDQSRWVDLTGVSGHPYHEHYGDQTELWRTGESLPMRWDEGAVQSAARHRQTLVPADAEG